MTREDYIHLFKEACGDKCNAEHNPCAYRQAADALAALKPVAWKHKDLLHKFDPDWALSKVTSLYALDEDQP
jgi:hypothetical protein